MSADGLVNLDWKERDVKGREVKGMHRKKRSVMGTGEEMKRRGKEGKERKLNESEGKVKEVK